MTTQTGTIKYVNDDKSYGFNKREGGGPDIFFHFRQFPAAASPQIGMRVCYDTALSPRSGKPEAVGVRVLG